MRKLIKLICLLNELIFILAMCPDRPILPISPIPKDNPLVIGSYSPGISHFPESTTQLSFALTVTPAETCPPESNFNIFSLTVAKPNDVTTEILGLSVDCGRSNFTFALSSDFLLSSLEMDPIFTSTIGSISVFVSVDLTAQNIKLEYRSVGSNLISKEISFSSPSTRQKAFDENTKLNICSGKHQESPLSCTVSELNLLYDYFRNSTTGFTGGMIPKLAAFYPLTDGSLADSTNSLGPIFFGNDGSDPTWASSMNFLKFTSTQHYFTVPLPSILPGLVTNSASFTISAWIRFSSETSATSTIFSMHTTDGTPTGCQLKMSGNSLTTSCGGSSSSSALNVIIIRGLWQLIGFSASTNSNNDYAVGNIFFDTSVSQFYLPIPATTEFTNAKTLRIGSSTDSFIGDISGVRIMTPGSMFISQTPCSTDNILELGVDSFSLLCSEGRTMNTKDGQCYTPSETFSLPCPDHCKTCNQSKCLVCKENYLLYNEGCVSSCPIKTYSTGTTCESCPNNCDRCDGEKCLACQNNSFFYEGACITSCPIHTYRAGETCKACSPYCSECDANKCLSCNYGFSKYQKACVVFCPERTYSTSTTCEDCSENCAECNAKECTVCDDGYQLEDKACVAIPLASKLVWTMLIILCGGTAAVIVGLGLIYVCQRPKSEKYSRLDEESEQSEESGVLQISDDVISA